MQAYFARLSSMDPQDRSLFDPSRADIRVVQTPTFAGQHPDRRVNLASQRLTIDRYVDRQWCESTVSGEVRTRRIRIAPHVLEPHQLPLVIFQNPGGHVGLSEDWKKPGLSAVNELVLVGWFRSVSRLVLDEPSPMLRSVDKSPHIGWATAFRDVSQRHVRVPGEPIASGDDPVVRIPARSPRLHQVTQPTTLKR